jgi:hypothetical protein
MPESRACETLGTFVGIWGLARPVESSKPSLRLKIGPFLGVAPGAHQIEFGFVGV